MAFHQFSKTALFSSLRSSGGAQKETSPTPLSHLPRRGYHIDLGAREKADVSHNSNFLEDTDHLFFRCDVSRELLEEDLALKRFKSYKNSVKRASKVGDVLTIIVVAACSYELYAAATMKE